MQRVPARVEPDHADGNVAGSALAVHASRAEAEPRTRIPALVGPRGSTRRPSLSGQPLCKLPRVTSFGAECRFSAPMRHSSRDRQCAARAWLPPCPQAPQSTGPPAVASGHGTRTLPGFAGETDVVGWKRCRGRFSGVCNANAQNRNAAALTQTRGWQIGVRALRFIASRGPGPHSCVSTSIRRVSLRRVASDCWTRKRRTASESTDAASQGRPSSGTCPPGRWPRWRGMHRGPSSRTSSAPAPTPCWCSRIPLEQPARPRCLTLPRRLGRQPDPAQRGEPPDAADRMARRPPTRRSLPAGAGRGASPGSGVPSAPRSC